MREVYIGGGITKNVCPGGTMYVLDFNKILEISKENQGKELRFIATGDPWWNTYTVSSYEEALEYATGKKYCLTASDWSKFHVEVEDEIIDATIEMDRDLYKRIYRAIYAMGYCKCLFDNEPPPSFD